MIDRIRKAKAYRLTGGPTVVLAELWPHEVINAWKAAGGGAPVERAMRAAFEAVKMAVRQIDGRELTYDEVEAEWKQLVPRPRHRTKLAELLGAMHTPTVAEFCDTLDSVVISDDGEREIWTATLPGDRKVELLELDEETIGESLAAAEREARGGDAQELLMIIENLRRSLRSIDGRPVTAEQLAGTQWDAQFTMRETNLLRRLFNEMHTAEAEEVPLGEGSPVSGQP